MGNNDMIYAEYVRIIERRDNMLDGSFKDFRLYSVLGYFFVIVGTIKKLGVKIFNTANDNLSSITTVKVTDNNISDITYFIILLLLFFIIAIIAYRDLIKQTYIVHLDYNIKKFEEHLRNNILKESEIFILRKSWHEKFYNILKKTYSGFTAIFFLPLLVFPFFLFTTNKIYGIILSLIMLLVLVFYAILLNKIYESNHSKNKKAI